MCRPGAGSPLRRSFFSRQNKNGVLVLSLFCLRLVYVSRVKYIVESTSRIRLVVHSLWLVAPPMTGVPSFVSAVLSARLSSLFELADRVDRIVAPG